MRKTKIVCTIGPATEDIDTLVKMIKIGLNVGRLNFSHGTHEEHLRRIEKLREASKIAKIPVAIMLDTKGPEIRLGDIAEGKIYLHEGQNIVLTTEAVPGSKEKVSVNYPGLTQDVRVGGRILIDDGLIGLEVEKIEGNEVFCKVINGGEISSRKGVNIPGAEISLPPITEQDIEDIRFGIKHGLDFIAASFVRKASDVLEIRKILEEAGADIHIYAKIENQEGLQNIEEILQVSDGIMVARGDLGVEIPAEEVPLAQKMIISLCNKAGKPVITATQMLDSMMRNPRPTRAEASDVANAIFDGSDAIMLSGETAAGKWPVEAVSTMAQIALRIEEALDYAEVFDKKRISAQRTITDAISHATVNTANDLGATAIISATKSGQTARMVSKYRPKAPIIAATPREDVLRKLLIAWGITPILVADTLGTDEMIAEAVNGALCSGVITAGSLVVITAGVPVGIPGTTNLLKVHVVGDVVAAGAGIGDRVVNGKVKICLTAEDALARVKEGDILVAPATDRDYVPAMERAAAVITEEGGLTSHAAIVGLNIDTVVVVGVEKATEILKEDQTITVDGNHGHIYEGITHVL